MYVTEEKEKPPKIAQSCHNREKRDPEKPVKVREITALNLIVRKSDSARPKSGTLAPPLSRLFRLLRHVCFSAGSTFTPAISIFRLRIYLLRVSFSKGACVCACVSQPLGNEESASCASVHTHDDAGNCVSRVATVYRRAVSQR